MTREEFLKMCELSPNGRQLKAEFEAQEAVRLDVIPDVPIYDASERFQEREFQAQCEGWLCQRGYRRMTAPEATRAVSEDAAHCIGWMFHLWKPQGNPLCPDLIIFNREMSRSLCIELKCRPTFQPGQREMIEMGCWRLAYRFHEVEKMVREWEIAK